MTFKVDNKPAARITSTDATTRRAGPASGPDFESRARARPVHLHNQSECRNIDEEPRARKWAGGLQVGLPAREQEVVMMVHHRRLRFSASQ